MAIWQDLVDDHGFAAQYASVRRFVLTLRGAAPAEARVVITTGPGVEGQVDYGEGPMVRDPSTGKYRRTRLFVFTLGYSRKSVRLLVWRSSAQVWAELHERAFRRLGGTVQIVVLDKDAPRRRYTWGVPTVLLEGPYRCFFYSADRHEPRHVHIERDAKRAKFWLDPVRLARSGGFGAGELREIERLVVERAPFLVEKWDEYFNVAD